MFTWFNSATLLVLLSAVVPIFELSFGCNDDLSQQGASA
jgi:hypothetical protein